MTTTSSEYPPVSKRAAAMGLTVPSGLVILPANFETADVGEELHFPKEALTISKLLSASGIPVSRLGADARRGFIYNRDANFVVPTLFLAAELVKSPDLLTASISVIQEYLGDVFGQVAGDRKVEADLVLEFGTSGQCRKISYKGDLAGLKDLPKIVKTIARK